MRASKFFTIRNFRVQCLCIPWTNGAYSVLRENTDRSLPAIRSKKPQKMPETKAENRGGHLFVRVFSSSGGSRCSFLRRDVHSREVHPCAVTLPSGAVSCALCLFFRVISAAIPRSLFRFRAGFLWQSVCGKKRVPFRMTWFVLIACYYFLRFLHHSFSSIA